ncbi:CAP domain-containing protein [Egbenema bharatensis]|uniref:CAP domain-containing protein n=1 Tax=Egbenema bharatensis TaxID=3463334 RepID=UPI003A8BEA62
MYKSNWRNLALALALASLLGGCEILEQFDLPPILTGRRADRQVESDVPTGDYAELEQIIFEQINQYRAERGLPELLLNAEISEQARLHSEEMAASRNLSHDGFEERAEAISQAIPLRSAAENVAFNRGFTEPAVQATEGWIDSDGHRDNIEGNFDLTGIGVAQNAEGEYYFTQLFVRRR